MIYQDLVAKRKKIAVIGLGYVGLPLALEMARYYSVVGFDINPNRIEMMKKGIDPSKELDSKSFEGRDIIFTSNSKELKNAHFFIVAVPTDIDDHKVPDLNPLKRASKTVGRALKEGDYVVYESTVYPGCTEEECIPILEKYAVRKQSLKPLVEVRSDEFLNLVDNNSFYQLKSGKDFKLGYSPERINPGDKKHTLTKIKKVVAGCDDEALNEIAKVYGKIIEAGVYKAESIKVAEAAKIIENTQRDINIAFMNELSIIFDKMDINTTAVLKAAQTKWNFLKFYPGLVGGHCIGVDPYYLSYKSQKLGYTPQVILSGRNINDQMPYQIARRLIQMLIQQNKNLLSCKVLVKGITFKENVSDIRNSKVVPLVKELIDFSIKVHVTDPKASKSQVENEYQLCLQDKEEENYDLVLLAVGHKEYHNLDHNYFKTILSPNGIIADLKSILPEEIRKSFNYWSM